MRLLSAIAERRTPIAVAAGALLLDQVTKDLAVTLLTGEAPLTLGPFALTFVRNPGAALGVFGALPESLRLPLVFFLTALVVFGLLPLIAIRVQSGRRRQVGIALVVSGALGNLIDRVRHGFVIDFLTLNPRLSDRFPIFNLADVALVAGALLLILFLRRGDLRPASALLGMCVPA